MRTHLPRSARPPEAVLADLATFRADDADYKGGKTWSMVYWASEEHHALVRAAHDAYLAENALNPTAFRSLKEMEAEIVSWTARMLHGPPSTVGALTGGGTESLLLAMKTWRDAARARRPWVRRPNVVLPASAHPAFDKAAHLFGLRLKKARLAPDGAVDLADVRRKIDRNTILLVGSAPQYPHGTVDPIPALGELALARGLPLHVDACFGGFILPWLERLGVSMPAWDLRVPGVRSISADAHKYGYAAKGVSVLLYREMEDMKHQFFVETGWCGGIYASASLPGTRPGGPIAACWAAMQALGEEGYLKLAHETWANAQALRAGLSAIPELRLLGRPNSPIVAWTSADPQVDVYALADRLAAAGWSVDRQQHPACIHLSVNPANGPVIADYLRDVHAAILAVRANPEASREGEAAMYGLMARVPLRGLVDKGVRDMMMKMYAPGVGVPDLAAAAGEDRVSRLGARALDAWDGLKRRIGR